MTLRELSVEYRKELVPMGQRIQALRKEKKTCPPERLPEIEYRLNRLTEVYRDTRALAELLEHYYERSFYRNGKYTL